MHQIITISREFGSGGRELGKRLADYLHIPCYDQEIIDMAAERSGLNKEYIAHISERDIRTFYPSTIGHRLVSPPQTAQQPVKTAIAQHEIIRQLAGQGDCVIVGRCADIVCQDMEPFNLFVYADPVSKLARCQERAEKDEHISEREMLRRMKKIDRDRAAYRELFTEARWGDRGSYHLCVNTSGREIKALVPAIGEYAKSWFEARDKDTK